MAAQVGSDGDDHQALLAAGDWSALSVPSPEDGARMLRAGETVEVQCHKLRYDLENEVVWGTNAYGVDFLAFRDPSAQNMDFFLRRLLSGGEFGAQP